MIMNFLVFEVNGLKGNALTEKTPFQWLDEKSEEVPDLVLLNWTRLDIPQDQVPGETERMDKRYQSIVNRSKGTKNGNTVKRRKVSDKKHDNGDE